MQTLRSKKEELLKEVYVVMSATLGVPPKVTDTFTYDYYDKDGKAGSWTGTPKQFFRAFAYDKYSVSEELVDFPEGPRSLTYRV